MILLTKNYDSRSGCSKMRSFTQRNKERKAKSKVAKTNVPEWTAKEYKHVATAEEKAKLEELKRSMLED